MDSKRWIRAAGAAGGLTLFAAILGWFLWMNLRTPPLAQRGETVGPVEPVPTAPQDHQVRAPPARDSPALAVLPTPPAHRPGRRDPANPTPINIDTASLNLPRNVFAPAPVYLPLATLPEGFTPQVDPALAAREAADKATADELAALGRGPTHIMAMAADGGTRVLPVGADTGKMPVLQSAPPRSTGVSPVPNAPGSGIGVPPMGHGQDARATKNPPPRSTGVSPVPNDVALVRSTGVSPVPNGAPPLSSVYGNLWIASEMQGVYRYTPATGQWTRFTTRDGLGDDYAYAVTVDRKGRVWVGHLNHGVSVYNGVRWQNYEVVGGISTPTSLSGPLGERIFDIAACPTDGDVWIASSLGLARYSESRDEWSYYTRGGYFCSTGVPPVPNAPGSGMGVPPMRHGQDAQDARATDNPPLDSSTGVPPVPDRFARVGADTGKMPVLQGALPSDQANAIAFDADGNIYVGTQCDGLAIAQAADNYATWRIITGPERMPTVPKGQGLPTNLINDVLVTRDGTLFVATTLGVAESRDRGQTFTYSRGADWGAKVRGLYGGPPAGWTETPGAMYLEDYVTCLAEGADGLLWVGYRTKGWEAIDPKTGRRPDAVWSAGTEFVNAIVPAGHGAYVGLYGGGLRHQGQGLLSAAAVGVTDSPALPSGAKPPSVEELERMTAAIEALASDDAEVAYLGEDWTTQGDWMGRYGRNLAVLCGANSPLSHYVGLGEPYEVHARIGPHAPRGDGLRCWVHWLETDDQRSLWDPYEGHRRQAEWDDHGEAFPMTHEGPDLWIRITLPEGVYRLSLYFVNKDGRTALNKLRDYNVEIKADARDIEDAIAARALLRCRVVGFWGGVYKRFVLRGPTAHYVHIARNASFNTTCSAILIDKLMGPTSPLDHMPRAMMGNLTYDPPARVPLEEASADVRAAAKVWRRQEALDGNPGVAAQNVAHRVLMYRLAASEGAPRELLAAWRWAASLWAKEDREIHNRTMELAWQGHLQMNPHVRMRLEARTR